MTRSSHVTVQVSPGLKRMRLPNRSLQVCVIERSAFAGHAAEFGRAGLYVLIDDPFEILQAYVGETEALSTRLAQHFRDPGKSQYHAVITVHDDGTLLDKLGAKYLEHRVVAMLSQHGLITNSVRPTAPRVADHIADALEELISDLQFVCFSVNLNLFERQRVRQTQTRLAVRKANIGKSHRRVTEKMTEPRGHGWSQLVEWLQRTPTQVDSVAIVQDFIAQGGPAGEAPKGLHLAAHQALKTAVGLGFIFKG